MPTRSAVCGRHRLAVGRAANAVGAEEFACHRRAPLARLSRSSARSRPGSGAPRWRGGTASVPPISATAAGIGDPARERNEGRLRRPVVPILAQQLALLLSWPKAPPSARMMIAPSSTSALGMAISVRWTAAQIAKPHIIGWRVIANTPFGPPRSVRARRPAPDCRRTSRRAGSTPSHIATSPAIQPASPAFHSGGLAADRGVKIDHRAEGHQRDDRVEMPGTALPRPPGRAVRAADATAGNACQRTGWPKGTGPFAAVNAGTPPAGRAAAGSGSGRAAGSGGCRAAGGRRR